MSSVTCVNMIGMGHAIPQHDVVYRGLVLPLGMIDEELILVLVSQNNGGELCGDVAVVTLLIV